MTYSRILVGTDGSDTANEAVQAAAELARQLGAELHVVTAYRSSSPGMGTASGAGLGDLGAGEALRSEAAKEVARKAVDAWGAGLTTGAHAAPGAAADAIVETARSIGADLIVVGSKGMRGARRVLGSVPNSVAHGADSAVLIVKTG
jgi:nucleotide-binding universal stress UspA family protein